MVTECGDPYEPSATVALVESIEAAKALGFKELWQFERREKRPTRMFPEGCEHSVYRELISGAEFASTNGACYPQPLIEWVETGVLLVGSDFSKGEIWHRSPNKKKS